MQVIDITGLFSNNNQMINICDLRDGNAEDVYTGPISSMPFEYDRCEVCSLDPLDDGSDIEAEVRELCEVLGVVPEQRKLLDPAFLQALLSLASNMMDSPTKYFDAAGCYSISGLSATSEYMNVLRENRFALLNENEYKIAEAFFEYLERRKREV